MGRINEMSPPRLLARRLAACEICFLNYPTYSRLLNIKAFIPIIA